MIYQHIWPIVDDERTLSMLTAEASAALDVHVRRAGARITGQPTWRVAGDRLVCQVPAEPAEAENDPDGDAVAVMRLSQLGWSDDQIGDEFGWDADQVAALRTQMCLPQGSGVAELGDPVAA